MIRIKKSKKRTTFDKLRILGILLWVAVIVFVFINRKAISVDTFINIMPQNVCLIIAIILLAFALKSVTFVFYVGILFAVTGVIFPFGIACVINLAGAAIMLTLPYLIGRSYGESYLSKFSEKYPKLSILETAYVGNDFLFSMLLRMIKLVNNDLASMYLGARGLKYWKYLLGSITAILPELITATIMGMGISQGSLKYSLIFIAEEVISTIASIVIIYLMKRKKSA